MNDFHISVPLPYISTSKYVTKETRLHCAQLWLTVASRAYAVRVRTIWGKVSAILRFCFLSLLSCLVSILTSLFSPLARAPCRQTYPPSPLPCDTVQTAIIVPYLPPELGRRMDRWMDGRGGGGAGLRETSAEVDTKAHIEGKKMEGTFGGRSGVAR